ncbi:ATP-binding protein [Geodermatophilus sabuli]|uniref:Regulatory protein, luxR family n=1 Tax=Geodermatophilus sabuli TaxID=1564158 RepID=A0A285EEP0_9ACTN|nr:AAA family ATPase [Geodermatophilus sabuli]MBB3084062.1 DNA-binding CsgD family transcriptional regulator [Geodermatophilus sabuli]SNX96664.1 regulatory protein, luxR family [Geodermatophilus sabuli]
MRTSFVGRDRESAVLEDCLASALAGRPSLVLCRGQPGIGKTRLAEELSAEAASAGAVVVWGRAPEAAGAPPYWPWRQVLRAAGQHADLHALARDHRLTAELARLAPDLFQGVQDGTVGPGTAEDRFRLFDAVDRLLRLLSQERPLVIVLDDAHWADDSSLLLLQHLADSMSTQRLLLLVSYRDTEPLGDVLLVGLARTPATRVLEIGGLSLAHVGAQLASVLGEEVSDRDVEQVHARTGGNPFYVTEVARALADGTDELVVPAGVRDAIRARLRRLRPETVELLQAASVVGREFPLTLVADMLRASELTCLPLIEEAAAAGLVAGSPPGDHRFVHDLVRDAVEAGLVPAERVRLHRSAADAVERMHTGRLEPHLSDLARHWAAAAASGERERAAEWITRAAEEAMRRLAYEEAARLYRLALTVGAVDIDDGRRCRLLLGAAGALKSAGELSGRLPVCRDAAALARVLRRPDLLAEAALAMEGGESSLEAEVLVRASCAEALTALPPSATALRAKVAANLSTACMYLGDLEVAGRASAHALAMADRSADPASLAAALRARQLVASGPEGMEERATLADRISAVGHEGQDSTLRMWGHLWRIDVAFERGDLAAVSRELEPLARCVADQRTPVARWHLLQTRAVLAQAVGRFADARLLADRAVAALPPSAAGRESAQINRTALLSLVGLHTGDAPELTGLLGYGPGDEDGDGLDFPIEGVIFSIAAAFFLADAGLLGQAATLYRRLGPPASWRPTPHATTSSFALGIGTAIALDASDDVAVLRGRLAPLRGRHVADGAGAVAYNGPVELYLGSAEAHLELLDEAVVDLEAAAQACARNGAAGFAVQSRFELATVLTRRARPGDLARARTLSVGVVEQASALGMAPWVERGRRLVDRLDDERGNPLTPREREVAVLVGEGLTNRQIAARLYLSERTAQNHVQHILTKLDLPNRSQIAVWVTTRT